MLLDMASMSSEHHSITSYNITDIGVQPSKVAQDFNHPQYPHVFASGPKTVLVKLTFSRTFKYVTNILFFMNHFQVCYKLF